MVEAHARRAGKGLSQLGAVEITRIKKLNDRNFQVVFVAVSLGQEIDDPPPKAASFSHYLSWICNATLSSDSASSLDGSVKTARTWIC